MFQIVYINSLPASKFQKFKSTSFCFKTQTRWTMSAQFGLRRPSYFEFFFFKIRDLIKMDRGVQPYSELASFKVHRMSGCFAKTQTG